MCRDKFEEYVLEETIFLVFRQMANGVEGMYCDPVVEQMWKAWKECWDSRTAGA